MKDRTFPMILPKDTESDPSAAASETLTPPAGIVRALGLGIAATASEHHGPATIHRSDGKPSHAENCRLPDGTRTSARCVTVPAIGPSQGQGGGGRRAGPCCPEPRARSGRLVRVPRVGSLPRLRRATLRLPVRHALAAPNDGNGVVRVHAAGRGDRRHRPGGGGLPRLVLLGRGGRRGRARRCADRGVGLEFSAKRRTSHLRARSGPERPSS